MIMNYDLRVNKRAVILACLIMPIYVTYVRTRLNKQNKALKIKTLHMWQKTLKPFKHGKNLHSHREPNTAFPIVRYYTDLAIRLLDPSSTKQK